MSKRRRKGLSLALAGMLLLGFPSLPAKADYQNSDTVYDAYVYENGEPVSIRMPYVFTKQLAGEGLPEGTFGELSDLFYCKEDEKLYIADSKTGSIVVMNKSFETEAVLHSFERDGEPDSLSGASGVCVRDGIVYVADTGNSRIVTFGAKDHTFLRSFDKPEIVQLGEEYNYQPIRLAVGITGQMYVVAKGVNSGFIVLDKEGNFQSFVGAPEVKTNPIDEMWKLFMTKEQRAALLKSVPTEYNSVMFDKDGFLYATTRSEGVQPITRLNLQGVDILKYPDGALPDGDTGYERMNSAFVDVCVSDSGVYYALDAYAGHIFAYDSRGNLLFAFGRNGAQAGTTNSPIAIELVEDKLLVADAVTGRINVFTCTEFGAAVLAADEAMNAGDYEIAKERWGYVIDHCSSFTLAEKSLGKLALYEKDYGKAMDQSKKTASKEDYSEAFRAYRSSFINDHYRVLLLAVVLLVIVWGLYKKFWLPSKACARWKESRLGKGLAYERYCSFHPLDGFWCLKREKRGNLLTATVTIILFLLVYLINVQFRGYLFLQGQPEDVDALLSLLAAVGLMICYCVGNWCFTSLMDGKGTMKDIFIAMAAGLRPYITGGLVLFVLSHVLTLQEAFLYNAISAILMLWVAGLIFFGMMMTHDYLLGKGILTMILTIIGMALIVFIGLMVYNLVDDMVSFIYGLYRELLYRRL